MAATKKVKSPAPDSKYMPGCIEAFTENNIHFRQAVQKISVIAKKENFRKKISDFSDQTALNLDLAESSYKKGKAGSKTNPTVDIVIGLEKKCLLLVEAKFDVKTVGNIKDNLKQKINYSRRFLRECNCEYRHHPCVVILLMDENFQQKSNELKRLFCNDPNISPLRLSDLFEKFF